MRRPTPTSTLSLTVLSLLAVVPFGADADSNWPSLRGPLNTGVAPGANPPIEWSEEKNVLWKVELEGTGHASPAVWGDRVYVLSAVNTEPRTDAAPPPSSDGRPPRAQPTQLHEFVVTAYDLGSGTRVWRTVVREEVPHESLHPTASQASASPVTDGEYIWAFFGSRGLYCLDLAGKVLWEADFGTQNTRNEFGEGSTPLVHADRIVVNWDHEGDSFIVALNKRTGEEVWRRSRDEPSSWSTPIVLKDGDRDLVVVSAANRVRAYDLASGEELWQAGGLGLNVIPTPVADDQTVWVMSGWREAHGMAIRYPGARGDVTGTERVLWETGEGLSYVPSSVLVDGRIYFFQRFSGILSCYALSTGEPCYDRQRIQAFENIYASPVAAGDRIYTVSRDGEAVVFRAGDKFEILARNQLDDGFNATPAIVDDMLVLRGDRYLYAIGATR